MPQTGDVKESPLCNIERIAKRGHGSPTRPSPAASLVGHSSKPARAKQAGQARTYSQNHAQIFNYVTYIIIVLLINC